MIGRQQIGQDIAPAVSLRGYRRDTCNGRRTGVIVIDSKRIQSPEAEWRPYPNVKLIAADVTCVDQNHAVFSDQGTTGGQAAACMPAVRLFDIHTQSVDVFTRNPC